MLFHVPPQITRLLAGKIAFLASKGFLASVRQSVILQTFETSARKVALIAYKRFFFRMLPHMCLESTSVVARIAALVTSEMLLP